MWNRTLCRTRPRARHWSRTQGTRCVRRTSARTPRRPGRRRPTPRRTRPGRPRTRPGRTSPTCAKIRCCPRRRTRRVSLNALNAAATTRRPGPPRSGRSPRRRSTSRLFLISRRATSLGASPTGASARAGPSTAGGPGAGRASGRRTTRRAPSAAPRGRPAPVLLE